MVGRDDEGKEEDVALTGKAMDRELFGAGPDRFAGYDAAIAVGEEDEEQDERERLVARWGSVAGRIPASSAPAALPRTPGSTPSDGDGPGSGARPGGRRRARCVSTAPQHALPLLPRSKLASYTAPKSVLSDLPTQEDGDQVRCLCSSVPRAAARLRPCCRRRAAARAPPA